MSWEETSANEKSCASQGSVMGPVLEVGQWRCYDTEGCTLPPVDKFFLKGLMLPKCLEGLDFSQHFKILSRASRMWAAGYYLNGSR